MLKAPKEMSRRAIDDTSKLTRPIMVCGQTVNDKK